MKSDVQTVDNTYDSIRAVLAPMTFGDEVKLAIFHFCFLVKFGPDGFTIFETDYEYKKVYREYLSTPSLKEAVNIILT